MLIFKLCALILFLFKILKNPGGGNTLSEDSKYLGVIVMETSYNSSSISYNGFNSLVLVVAQYVRAAGPTTRVTGSNPLELVSTLLSKI